MKSLEIIQLLAKLGKIFSKIIYICAIVGVCACLVGAVLLPLGAGEVLKLGGVTIHSILSQGVGIPKAWMAMAGAVILCSGEVVVAKYAFDSFSLELEAGTPFTREGADRLWHLGLLAIFVPMGCAVAAAVVRGVAEQLLQTELEMTLSNDTSITLGAALLVLSLLCRCGAEALENQEPEELQ